MKYSGEKWRFLAFVFITTVLACQNIKAGMVNFSTILISGLFLSVILCIITVRENEKAEKNKTEKSKWLIIKIKSNCLAGLCIVVYGYIYSRNLYSFEEEIEDTIPLDKYIIASIVFMLLMILSAWIFGLYRYKKISKH